MPNLRNKLIFIDANSQPDTAGSVIHQCVVDPLVMIACVPQKLFVVTGCHTFGFGLTAGVTSLLGMSATNLAKTQKRG